MSDLLTPVQLGPYSLNHRVVMAPLTRMRAGVGNVPTELNVRYYQQRASRGGLMISEATQISPQGYGYANTPGIHSPEQIAGWQKITKAVHEQGGYIFLQLWHVGRVSHPSLQPNGEQPVAPSAIAPEGVAFTHEGEKPFVTPRALETDEIPGIVEDYRQAAKNAIAAGFDGVEVHSANGYLLDQFLHESSNQRTDQYGGSIANRSRLTLEVMSAVTDVCGSDKVGIRLSPSSTFGDMEDSNKQALFDYLVRELNQFNLAYLHLIEPRIKGNVTIEQPQYNLGSEHYRPLYQGTLLAAGGYNQETGNQAIAQGTADLMVYGRLFIANPDLPKRFCLNAPLNDYNRETFYGGDETGYIDYPFLEETEVTVY
jgi:N-ethylmaleimide reductase